MKHPTTLSRRSLIKGLAGMGTTAALTGLMSVSDNARKLVLDSTSHWNDRVQANLFSQKLAPEFPDSEISNPFRYNGFYPQAYAPVLNPESWRLSISGGSVEGHFLSLRQLNALEQHSQQTELICIEGWSAIGRWAGPRLSDVLHAAGIQHAGRYVHFKCADGYYTSIDIASALHPQTILATSFLGRPLPVEFGAPMRLRIPTKLGFKNAKFVTEICVSNTFSGGFWEDKGYNWFAGL